MKFANKLINSAGGALIASTIRACMGSLDFRAALYDPTVDPVHENFQGPSIFLVWHEYLPVLLHLRGRCNTALLLSKHQDAEWLSQATRRMGFDTVRGSTSRGGVAALRELLRKSRSMNLAMTPDGPRGPRRRLAAGAIYLSSRLGIPLIAVGLGYARPWRMPTWDRFAVPKPFSTARVVASPRIQIPPHLDREGVERQRQYIENILNRLTTEAETWAESGKRSPQQILVRRQVIPLHLRRAA